MRVIIYNINSFGGNYEYSKYLFKAYSDNSDVEDVTLLMPSNAEIDNTDVLKTLYTDIPSSSNKIFRKLHFLYRSFVNPIRLYKYLKKQRPSIIIYNDYDQITALFWAPFIRLLKNKHRFAVILHDPDRDDFFSIKFLSDSTMKSVMSCMDIAFYHGYLPDRKYYKGKVIKTKVPHGIYSSAEIDDNFFQKLRKENSGYHIIGILGNIRPEKNYEAIMDALTDLHKTKLLIAGAVSNSSVSLDHYKAYATKIGVQEQIIWITEYLPISKFNAAIKICDIILLYYKESFTSQSGVLNSIAPYSKKLIISDSESSLKECVTKYHLGEVVPIGNRNLLVRSIKHLLTADDKNLNKSWQSYIQDSSWDKHVSIAVEQYKKLIDVF